MNLPIDSAAVLNTVIMAVWKQAAIFMQING